MFSAAGAVVADVPREKEQVLVQTSSSILWYSCPVEDANAPPSLVKQVEEFFLFVDFIRLRCDFFSCCKAAPFRLSARPRPGHWQHFDCIQVHQSESDGRHHAAAP